MTPFRPDPYRWAALALLLTGSLACSDDDPTGPVVMTLEGQGTLAAEATVGVIPCALPNGDVVTAFPRLLRSTGTFTDMGTTLGEIRTTACTVGPTGDLTASGEVLQTGADGAALEATFSATVDPAGVYVLEVSIVGGTGRFVGATGWLDGGGRIDPTTGSGDFELAGELTV